jgi:predicted SAM-dependent methyltransferase
MVMKLNLGCGDKRGPDGFTNVDIVKTSACDVVADLFKFPWPFEDNSVDEVYCIHFFEHVPAKLRPKFMDELYRVMTVGGVASIVTPSYNSERAYQDYTHEWPPIVPNSYQYFNKKWREMEKLTHGDYEMKCNFDYELGSNIGEEWKAKSHEVLTFSVEHYWNVSRDIVANLTKLEN